MGKDAGCARRRLCRMAWDHCLPVVLVEYRVHIQAERAMPLEGCMFMDRLCSRVMTIYPREPRRDSIEGLHALCS